MSRRVRRKSPIAQKAVFAPAAAGPASLSRPVVTAARRNVSWTRIWDHSTAWFWILMLVPVFQFALLLHLVWTVTPNVPIADEWAWVPLFAKFHAGTISLSDIWMPHNQHRIVLPRLIALPLYTLTAWNRQALMTVNLCIGGTSLLLTVLALRSTARTLGMSLLPLVPVSYLVLSLGEGQNWFVSFQIAFVLVTLGGAMCIWAFAHPTLGRREITLAFSGAIVASLSALGGLITWIAFLPCLARTGWKVKLAWAICGLGIGIPYFIGLDLGPSPHVSLLGYAEYALTFLGAPLAFQPTIAEFWGLTSVLLFPLEVYIYFRLRREIATIDAWIAAALFGLINAIVTSHGRATLGLQQALANRYFAASIFWWLGVLVIGILIVQTVWNRQEPHRLRYVSNPKLLILAGVTVITIALTASVAQLNVQGLQAELTAESYMTSREECVLSYRVAPDWCLQVFFPNAGMVRSFAPYLAAHRLSGFASRPIMPAQLDAESPARAGISILSINGVPLRFVAPSSPIAPGTDVRVEGAFLPASGRTFAMELDEHTDVPIVRESGTFVQTTYSNQAWVPFTATIPHAYLTTGFHLLNIKIRRTSSRSALLKGSTVGLFVQ